MLPKESRLRRKDDIERVFKAGRVWNTSYFSIKYLKEETRSGLPGRAAFSFSKKFLKKAVERNRLKRQISEGIQKVPDFSSCGLDCVFFLGKSHHPKEAKTIQKELESFMKKVYTKE